MGIAQAGLAFKLASVTPDMQSFVSGVIGAPVSKIPHPNVQNFDIRNHTDIMVQLFGDICFICNNDIVWDFLEDTNKNVNQLYHSLGTPDLFLAFCHYDSGGSYGYAFFERGERTRTRLQTTGVANLPPIIESGSPKPCEARWLSAPSYLEEDDCPIEERQRIFYQENPRVDVPEYYLTQRMLYEALMKNFGVCPWDTEVTPKYHFYKISSRKSWWQFW